MGEEEFDPIREQSDIKGENFWLKWLDRILANTSLSIRLETKTQGSGLVKQRAQKSPLKFGQEDKFCHRHPSKHYTYINLFNPHDNPLRQ